jgi:hypothetical protein
VDVGKAEVASTGGGTLGCKMANMES